MLKCENLPRTNSTKYETQNILVKLQQNEHTSDFSLLKPMCENVSICQMLRPNHIEPNREESFIAICDV